MGEQRGWSTPFDAGVLLECPDCKAVVKVPTCQLFMMCPQPDCRLKMQLADMRRRFTGAEEAGAWVRSLKEKARALGVPQPLIARREAVGLSHSKNVASGSSTALAEGLEQLILEQQIRPAHALAGTWLQPYELLGLNSSGAIEEYDRSELQEAAARVSSSNNPISAVAVQKSTDRVVGSTVGSAGVQLAFTGSADVASPASPARTSYCDRLRVSRGSPIGRQQKEKSAAVANSLDVQIALAERFWRTQLAAGDK